MKARGEQLKADKELGLVRKQVAEVQDKVETVQAQLKEHRESNDDSGGDPRKVQKLERRLKVLSDELARHRQLELDLQQAKAELIEGIGEFATMFGDSSFGYSDILKGEAITSRLDAAIMTRAKFDHARKLYLKLFTVLTRPKKFANCKKLVENADDVEAHALFDSITRDGNTVEFDQKLAEHDSPKTVDHGVDNFSGGFRDPFDVKGAFVKFIHAAIVLSAKRVPILKDQAATGSAGERQQKKTLPPKMRRLYYAPYTTICQSSGYGKSRLVIESADSFVLFYSCLRSLGSDGFPNRTANASHLLELTEVYEFAAFFAATLEVWTQWGGRPKTKDSLAQDAGTGKRRLGERRGRSRESKELEDATVVWTRTMLQEAEVESAFWGEVVARSKTIAEEFKGLTRTTSPSDLTILEGRLSKRMETRWYKNAARLEKKPFLFVFDEARVLLKKHPGKKTPPFVNLRRALRIFCGNMFAVFLDTSSRLTNYMPLRKKDPSSRASLQGEELFPPFYFLPNIGAAVLDEAFEEVRWCQIEAEGGVEVERELRREEERGASKTRKEVERESKKQEERGASKTRKEVKREMTLESSEDMGNEIKKKTERVRRREMAIESQTQAQLQTQTLSRIIPPLAYDLLSVIEVGRPLFVSSTNIQFAHESFDDYTACSILGSLVEYAMAKLCGGRYPPEDGDLLACACLRFGLCHFRAAFAQKLVKSNMATCFFISKDRERFIAKYTSEPLLAEAACHLLKADFERTLGMLVEGIRSADLINPDGGVLGELAVTILLLRAYEAAKRVGGIRPARLGETEGGTEMEAETDLDLDLDQQLQLEDFYCTPISLAKFLAVFLSDGERTQLARVCEEKDGFDWERLGSAWMCCTSAYQTKATMDGRLLLDAFLRNSILNAKARQPGFDVAIPLLYPTWMRGGEEVKQEMAREEKMGAILVQVKNHNSRPLCGQPYRRALDGLYRSVRELRGSEDPCVVMLIQVGSRGISEPQEGEKTRIFIRDNVLHIVKPWLDQDHFPFLPERELQLLQEIARTEPIWQGIADTFETVGLQTAFDEEETYAQFSPLEYGTIKSE